MVSLLCERVFSIRPVSDSCWDHPLAAGMAGKKIVFIIRKSGNSERNRRLLMICFTRALFFCCRFLPCPESRVRDLAHFSQNAACGCSLYRAVPLDPAASYLLSPSCSPLHIVVWDRLLFGISVLILVFPSHGHLPIAFFLACLLIVDLTVLWHKITSCGYYLHISTSYAA